MTIFVKKKKKQSNKITQTAIILLLPTSQVLLEVAPCPYMLLLVGVKIDKRHDWHENDTVEYRGLAN